jgi:hypothetical protein
VVIIVSKPKRAPRAPMCKKKKVLTPEEKLAAEQARLERFALEDREPSGRKRRKPKSRGNRSGESKGRKRRSGARPSRRTPSSVAAAREAMLQVERAVKEQMSVLSARNIRFRSRGHDPLVLLWNPVLTPGRRGRPPGKGHSNAKGILSYAGAPKLSELRRFLDAKGLRRGVPAVFLGQALASRPQLRAVIRTDDASASAPVSRESIQSTTRFNGLGLMARMFQDRRLLMTGVAESAYAERLSPARANESENESEEGEEEHYAEEDDSDSSEEEVTDLAIASAADELAPELVEALTQWRAEVAAADARVHKTKRSSVARAERSGKKPSAKRSGTRPRHAPRMPCLCAPTVDAWYGATGRAEQPLWLTLRGASSASSCFACPQCLLQEDVQIVDGWSERSKSRGPAARVDAATVAACSSRLETRKSTVSFLLPLHFTRILLTV